MFPGHPVYIYIGTYTERIKLSPVLSYFKQYAKKTYGGAEV
jgi:hypothetical protein